jgi:adenylate cyclase
VTALKCAVEAQRDLAERNKDLPENRKLQFRAGVNLGDIVVDGAEIYGDGVNVAARLEALAVPGGICVSRTVFNHVKGKVELGFEYLGEKKVKNIVEPVETYRVLLDPGKAGQVIGRKKPQAGQSPSRWQWTSMAVMVLVIAGGSLALWLRPSAPDMEPASVEHMALPLPEQPSVAVLPFDNMTGDPAVDYLADGLTEEIITTLSKVPDLLIIARNSTFTYKGKAVSVKQVAEEQGVRFVLEGSVQRSGDRVRINAQLIDAVKGTHVWAERYDRDLTDLFALQDDITQNIMVAMQVQLTDGEQARLRHARAPSAKAFEYQVKARAAYRRFTKEDNAKARELAEKATELAPNFAIGWGLQGVTHNLDGRFGWSASRKDSFEKAIRFAEKALSIDPELPEAFSLLGSIHLNLRQHDQAIAYAQKAVDLSPNHATMVAGLGHTLSYSGRPQEAIPLIRKAMRLSPYYPTWYVSTLGLATMMAGQYDESIAANEEAVQRKTLLTFAYSRLAGMHAQKGDMEKARSYAADLMKIKPKFNLESWAKALPYKNPDDLERELAMLRKAGFPEKPPLPLPDKPSIAVLPFDNLSGDPEDQFLADGLTEDIITTLSRVPDLFVIARNSTFTYKGKPVKVQQVAAELGVRYVLEGSLQRSGDRLRVTAQFIDANTGHHLWADRFDREVDDIFALQDEIAHKILIELQVKLTSGENARVASRGTKNLDAWLLRLQAFAEGSKYNKEGMLKARELFQEAVNIDPNYARAWGGLAWTDYFEARMGGWGRSREEALKEGITYAEFGIEVDPQEPVGFLQLANLFGVMGEHDRAVETAKHAVALAPNDYQTGAVLGMNLFWAGDGPGAVTAFEQSMRLSPRYPAWMDWMLGAALHMAGKPNEAVASSKKGVEREPKSPWPRPRLIAALSDLDRIEEAKAMAAEQLKIKPDFTVSSYLRANPFKDPAHKEMLRELLLKAGLPE